MPLIVILDDRSTNRNIFAKLAASVEPDIAVESFSDPLEALAWLETHPPDLVITDFKMPHIDGAEFTRRFRALPACEDVPLIVITVYEERNFRLKALENGATDFLLSPVDHNEFVTRARNLLKLRRQQEMLRSRASDLQRELIDSERSREALVRDSREQLAQVIDTLPAKISAFDREGRCVFMNGYKAALYGFDPAAAVGRSAEAILGEERGQRSRALDQLVLRGGHPLPSYEEDIVGPDGGRRVFLTTKSPFRDRTGRIVSVLTTSLDITDRKKAESHLVHLAHHDSLTGLPNRALLLDRMRREIGRARRGDRFFALHLLDLDRFKAVNDAFGHHVGDDLLRAVSERLAKAVRETDTVARLGGDEFAILQTDVGRPEDALDMARRIAGIIAKPIPLAGQEVVTSTSIGITVHPRDGEDVDELLKNADLAMYRAKARGRNATCLFAADMDALAKAELVLEADLRHALARQEFVLHYQPQIDLRTGRIIGAEALIRWQRPSYGLVRPGEFLPLAEENGLIIPINEWVLREACREAQSWSDAGHPPLRIAVNLSPVQFRKQNVHDLVTDVLAQSGLDPARLELELTETILMQDTENVASHLRALREMGVSLSIDDFGTGYSSLAYVKNFPVDRLKIDQCFIRNLKSDPNDAAIVRHIVSLGHSLGLIVVAEGVDAVEQIGLLRAEGCDEAQGFYYSMPVPPAEFLALVADNHARYAQSA